MPDLRTGTPQPDRGESSLFDAQPDDSVRVLLMLARCDGDDEPTVIGAVDQILWDHWDDADEARWDKECRAVWGDIHADYRRVWIRIAPDDLNAVYSDTEIEAEVERA